MKCLQDGPEPPAFDIVLMDLQMPEMDGYTATRLLRADPRFRSIPIVAMTAHALVEERQRCLEAGMNDHVTKPIEPDALFATLKRWAKPREQTAPTAAAVAGGKPAATASEADIPRIDGFDVEGGLRRVAGNRRLYRSLLGQFAAKQADAAAQIGEALRRGDRELAGRTAHTVKGVAGNLGIATVQAAAEKIERGIRGNDDSVTGMLPGLEAELGRAAAAIRSALAAEPSPPAAAAGVFDPAAAESAMARLKSLIVACDGEAAAAFAAVEAAVGAVVEKPALDALKAAIDEFDFDAAVARWNEVAEHCSARKSVLLPLR